MNTQEAVNIFKKKFPNKICIQIWDFDSNHYVIEAVDESNDIDPFAQTTFGIDKNTGAITGFSMNAKNAGLLQKESSIKLI